SGKGRKILKETNDVILHMVTKVVVFIILTLAIYLFIAGHNQPGGGFISGLVLSSAFVLLYLSFDVETVNSGLPLNFVVLEIGRGKGRKILKETNDVILHMVTKVVVFIILTLAIYLFIAGHNQPGGGFISGLVLSSAFVLLYLSFDVETVNSGLPLNFVVVAAVGVFLSVTTGFLAIFNGKSFLTHTFTSKTFPLIG